MEDNHGMIETLLHRFEDYAKTTLEIIKLKAVKNSTEVVSSIISSFILLFIATMFMLILSMGVSLWLGEMLDKLFYGFLIVAAFWAASGMVIYFFLSKRIKKLISDTIIKKALDNNE